MSKITRTGGSSQHEVIVATVISLAHQLGLKVIAEGVETESEATYLLALGAEFGQGYLFCKPMPASQIEAGLFESGFTCPMKISE